MKLTCLYICLVTVTSVPAFSQFKSVKINGAEIHYLDRGAGAPIVFIHGGMEDYRTWDPQLDTFSRSFRVISYSRRFNYPNHNSIVVPDFSAQTEADDLALLIEKLDLKAVHVVGHSYGGLVALYLALKNPGLVRSLTLSEPPMVCWLQGLTNGKKLYDDFFSRLIIPLKSDFKLNDTTAVLSHTLIYFYGADLSNELPSEVRAQLIANLPEWRSMALSTNPFPAVDKAAVQNLKMPVFLLSAGQTMPMLQVTNAELRRLLPNSSRFQLAEGTHDYWATHPVQMGKALMNFLKSSELK